VEKLGIGFPFSEPKDTRSLTGNGSLQRTEPQIFSFQFPPEPGFQGAKLTIFLGRIEAQNKFLGPFDLQPDVAHLPITPGFQPPAQSAQFMIKNGDGITMRRFLPSS
jgi:hypothetical protein